VSHTRKKANNYVSLKRGVSNALKHRIGETLKHRTPYIKQWMNSPAYKTRRREEVRQEIQKIESYIHHQTRLVKSYQEAVDRRKAAQLSDSLTSEERAALEMKQKEAQKYVNQYKKPLNRLRKNHNVLRDLERSLHE
jgi:septal ring factor EnvC (AmiA/AmiB activator)